MNRGILIVLSILALTLTYVACSEESPTSSSSLTAPTIQSPAVGATLTDLQPTLTVGNSTGGVGEPTYRFEISTDQGFSTTVAADEGIGQGASGSTSWQVTSVLDAGQTYYWRSRSSATGESSPWSSVASFATLGGFTSADPRPGGILIFDPLTVGSSVGEVGGGSFNERGWMATAADTYIRYRVPTLPNGFVEFDVTNLRNPNPRSDKRNLLIMWDPTAGEYTQNPYRVHIAKFDTRLVDRWYVRLRWISQGQEANTGYDFFQWNRNQVYHWRIEWGAFPEIVSSQRVQVFLDGQQIMARNYDRIYNPATHWIELGMAPRAETLEQAIFSNVVIGARNP